LEIIFVPLTLTLSPRRGNPTASEWGIKNLINMADCNKYNSSYVMRIPFLGWEYREKANVSQIETTTYEV
jgi:hypothetical protein